MEIDTPKQIITATIVLAVLPAYLYFITYMNEVGACSTLKIPTYLIEPSIGNVLGFGASIFSFFVFCFYFLNAVLPLRQAAKDPNKSHLRIMLLINFYGLIIGSVIFYVNPISWHIFFIILGIIIVLNLLYWILPLIYKVKDKEHTIKEKLSGIRVSSPIMLIDDLQKGLQKKDVSIIMFSCFLLPGLCYFLGRGAVIKNTDYEFINNSKNQIVLRKYGDLLICGTVNLKTKILTDSIQLIKIGDKEIIQLKTEPIGPLVFK